MESLTKLIRIAAKEKLTVADITFALDNWEDADFPRKLETKVRRWMKAQGCTGKHDDLQAIYAPLDEQSAKWLVDPCIDAQDAILSFKDQDDAELLTKRAVNFTDISRKLWRVISANASILSARTLKRLCDREDAPRAFITAQAEEEPAPVKRKSKKVEYEEPVRRGMTGSSRRVKRPAAAKVVKTHSRHEEADDDYDFEEKPKTVKKSSAIEKVRKVLKPAKKLSLPVEGKTSRKSKSSLNEEVVRTAARKVRRPRT